MKFRTLISMLLIVAIISLAAFAEDGFIIESEQDGEAAPAESNALLSETGDQTLAEESGLIEDGAQEQDALPQSEQADSNALKDFEIENGVLKKYVGSGGDVVIPGSVTSIGESAFSCCDSVTSVVVPDSVTFIGEYAFASCRNMTSITLPKGLSSLEWNLFGGCSKLKSVNIPNGITRIEGAVFIHCTSLPSITIPESVNSIGEDAFSGCESLKKITIPSGVTSIENGTFRQCKNLKTVKLPEGITNIGDMAFWDCASLTSLAIPSTVTTMGSSMFWNCTSLVSIIIPDSATGLWGMPFSGCTSLTTVVLSKSMDYLDGDIFEGCGNLATVVIPKSVTTIFEGTFKDCPNVTVYVEAGSYAEKWCKQNGVRYKVGEPPVEVVTPTPTAKPTKTPKPSSKPTLKPIHMDGNKEQKMDVGDEVKIVVDTGTLKSCSSDNEEIATVKDAVVTAWAQGTANITVKTKKPKQQFKLTVIVTDPTMPQQILFEHKEIELKPGEEITLNTKIKPSTASTGLSWTSNNTDIATVDKKGNVKAIMQGEAKITVKAKKDTSVKATILVRVVDPALPTKIVFEKEKLSISPRTSKTLKPILKPDTAKKSNLIWKSDNPNCVTVDSKGKIKALRPGKAIITAVAKHDKTIKATLRVTVKGKYRALLIGQRDYKAEKVIKGAITDANAIKLMLQGLGDHYTCTVRKNRTREGILDDINTYLVKPSTEDDVSIFYYAGHGEFSQDKKFRGALVGINRSAEKGSYLDNLQTYELAEALNRVKGRVIVIIDACYSGAYIYKNSGRQPDTGSFDPDAFVQDFVQAFDEPDIVSNLGELRNSKYVVLVAATVDEESHHNLVTGRGLFTSALVKGMGCNYSSGKYKDKSPADKDKSNSVTVLELYNYIRDYVRNLSKQSILQYALNKQTAGYYAKDKNEILFVR